MRRLLEDLTDLSRWQRCCRKPDLFEVTYSTTHAVYLNKTDNTVTTANKRTPIVVRDEGANYWTISIGELRHNYVTADGNKITDDFLAQLKTGEFFAVRAQSEYVYWVYHVAIADYGYDCPYKANSLDMPHGTGDYLVCKGVDKPLMNTVKVVQNSTYKRLYATKR